MAALMQMWLIRAIKLVWWVSRLAHSIYQNNSIFIEFTIFHVLNISSDKASGPMMEKKVFSPVS